MLNGLTLKPDVKARWVTALRSGDYHQFKGYLKIVDGYTGKPVGHCCLGVLSEVVGVPSTVREMYTSHDEYLEIVGFKYENDDTSVHETTMYSSAPADDLFDCDESALGEYADKQDAIHGVFQHLAELNDTGSDFSQIADFIESNL